MYTTSNPNKIVKKPNVFYCGKLYDSWTRIYSFILEIVDTYIEFKKDYIYTQLVDEALGGMPIITLEVMAEESKDPASDHIEEEQATEPQDSNTGVHFLNDKNETSKCDEKEEKESSKGRTDLLEYMMRNDGSVICKLCGEVLQSRTHWYRHKYKLHVPHPLNPSPLFQCEQCLVYFKSRKGYIGHIASRHSETLSDSSPVLTNTQVEAMSKENSSTPNEHSPQEAKESDPEASLPKSSVLNYQTSVLKQAPPKPSGDTQKLNKSAKAPEANNKTDLDEKRSREEKLVADIIAKVRKECEAQGTGGGTRRGYTRRTTVMHT